MISKSFTGFQWMVLLIILMFDERVQAQDISFSEATVLISQDISSTISKTCLKVLQEEIQKRTSIKIEPINNWVSDKAVMALCLESSKELLGKDIPQSENGFSTGMSPEGFRLLYQNQANENDYNYARTKATLTTFNYNIIIYNILNINYM